MELCSPRPWGSGGRRGGEWGVESCADHTAGSELGCLEGRCWQAATGSGVLGRDPVAGSSQPLQRVNPEEEAGRDKYRVRSQESPRLQKSCVSQATRRTVRRPPGSGTESSALLIQRDPHSPVPAESQGQSQACPSLGSGPNLTRRGAREQEGEGCRVSGSEPVSPTGPAASQTRPGVCWRWSWPETLNGRLSRQPGIRRPVAPPSPPRAKIHGCGSWGSKRRGVRWSGGMTVMGARRGLTR